MHLTYILCYLSNLKHEEFILAHELGHAILHTDVFIKQFNAELVNISKYERQATYFAFKLLNLDLDYSIFKNLTYEQLIQFLESSNNFLYSLVD